MSDLLPSYGTIFCSKIRSSTHIPNVFGREVISILKDVKNYDISYHSVKGEERDRPRFLIFTQFQAHQNFISVFVFQSKINLFLNSFFISNIQLRKQAWKGIYCQLYTNLNKEYLNVRKRKDNILKIHQ